MHAQLASELMKAIMSVNGREGDTFFEEIITDLLVKIAGAMGTITRGIFITTSGFQSEARKFAKNYPV